MRLPLNSLHRNKIHDHPIRNKSQVVSPIVGELTLALGIVLLILISRLTIDVPDFKPVTALAFWPASFFIANYLNCAAVLGMLTADSLIGFYDWRVAIVVYVAFCCRWSPGVAANLQGQSLIVGRQGSLGFQVWRQSTST